MSAGEQGLRRGDNLLNSYKSQSKKCWKEDESLHISQEIHGVFFKAAKTISGLGREAHGDSLIQKASKYRFPNPPTPVPIGFQAMHPCWPCVQAHEKDSSVMCIKGKNKCVRCEQRRENCNQDGQVPAFNNANHHHLYNYRLALAREENTWPVKYRFMRRDLNSEFFQELHSMRPYILAEEEKEKIIVGDVTKPRNTPVPESEARAVQLYNYTCQSIAKYSLLTKKARNLLVNIKTKHSNSRLLRDAALPDSGTAYDGESFFDRKLDNQPDDRIVLYPAMSNEELDQSISKGNAKSSVSKRLKKPESSDLSSETDSDDSYQPVKKRQRKRFSLRRKVNISEAFEGEISEESSSKARLTKSRSLDSDEDVQVNEDEKKQFKCDFSEIITISD